MSTHTDKPSSINGTGYVALRDYFTLWLERMEEFYNERFKSQQIAIQKAEAAQASYNQGHNDLLRKMDEQHKETLPRTEAASKFENMQKDIIALDKSIQALRESGSAVTGRDLQRDQSRQSVEMKQAWTMPMVAAIGLGILSILFNLILFIAPMMKGH